jgi:alpha-mannosidase
MKNKNSYSIIITGIIIIFWISLCGVSGTESTHAIIESLEQEMNTQVESWESSGSANKEEWDSYKIRSTVKEQEFLLKTVIKGTDLFCGTKVIGTPLHIRLTLFSRGYSQVNVLVNGQKLDTFVIDGSSGTGKEEVKEVLIAKKAEAKGYAIVLEVTNKGYKPFRTEYWPPRKKELKEEGIYFIIKKAVFVYPNAAGLYKQVKDWLFSMQTADTLLNPDFRRFTFTGKPYEIPDKRKVSKARLKELNGLWQKAVALFDMEALQKGDAKKVLSSIKKSYRVAKKLRKYAKEFKVHLIGNAHIDIAWLWRIYETVLVARNTYDTVIKNMGEYPELHYAQSQALTYQWIEQKYPELFQKIKEAYKTGRWEIVGGMWVEPDCNLISGESWVRQILYGKKYFKDKFGIDVKTGWNVDSFGYNWNMPQIYRKSGIDRFVTQKIWWNDTTVFPYYIFWWEGVDGTRLLSYFPPVGYTSRVKLPRISDNITKYEATTGYKKSLILYGIGDHGGGPNREILNRVRKYNKLYIAPDFIHSNSRDFLKGIEKDMGKDIPVWKDELYLEYHRGTYTTQAETKKNNRKSESMISGAEKIAAIAHLTGSEYPQKELEDSWKIILTNQFHDILPGSSIAPVYHDAQESYRKAQKIIKKVENASFKSISERINTSKIKGIPLVVFNPMSWKRTDIVTFKYPSGNGKRIEILDPTGKEIPVEITYKEGNEFINVAFIAKDIPSLGYKCYSLERSEHPSGPSLDFPSDLKVNGYTLENQYHRVAVNPKTGNIKSIYNKILQKEFVTEGKEANLLQVYEDRPENWDAWNIGYTGRMWELNKADSVEVVKETPVRVVLKVKKSFLGLSKSRYSPTEEFPSSFFTQYITLYSGLDRIDIKTHADWWEDHMFLKAAFPVNIKSDVAAYEIPFATINRTTKSETLWEKARFEVAALKWADLSQDDCGISLLNDSKYGYDIHSGVMKLSLLRAPTWPDPMADRGKHTFVYSLYTHKGTWKEAETVKRGHELNLPMVTCLTYPHPGELPLEYSFFKLDSQGVILDSMKKSEDGNAVILRFYESRGMKVKTVLTLFESPKKVIETNLMEEKIKELIFEGKSVTLEFKKYEIKTLKIQF